MKYINLKWNIILKWGIFLDEKDVSYKYVVIKGDVVQTGFSGSSDKGKHAE